MLCSSRKSMKRTLCIPEIKPSTPDC
jgi:hypothetical protein